VHGIVLLGAPLAVFGVMALSGFGLAVLLGPRFAPDAQAALAPPLGVAVLAAASVLLSVGVPAVPLWLAALLVPTALTVAMRKRVYPALRSCGRPFAVALVALLLAGAPSFVSRDWTTKSYGGNTDAYFWVSQARGFYDAPPPAPSSTYPDRLAFERVDEQHWAVALPFITGGVAWTSGSDPADVYALVTALVAALLPLAAFFCARACLDWGSGRATAAGLALAVNASLLFASYFSWQQQLLGTALMFGALVAFRLALDRPGTRRPEILAAFFASAALASYRMALAPYFAAMLAVVLGSFLLSHDGPARRQALRAALSFSAFFLVLGAGSVVALGLGLRKFVSLGVATSFKESFPSGQVAEALGFVPTLFGASFSWGVIATAAAIPLFALPLVRLRRTRGPRTDFLFGSTLVLVATYVVLLRGPFPPYMSYKLLAYGAPFFTLVVFSANWLTRPGRARTAAAVAITLLLLTSSAVAVAAGASDSKSAGDLAGLKSVSPRLGHRVVSVRLTNPWDQAWATYYLRDVPLSVEEPTFVLIGVALRRPPEIYHHPGASYVLDEDGRGSIWNGSGVALDQSPTVALQAALPTREPSFGGRDAALRGG
jgi:hypothetical protein